MHDQHFTYSISRKDQTHIEVNKKVRNAIRIFANAEGLSIVATTYLIIKTGIDCLLDMEKRRKRITRKCKIFCLCVLREEGYVLSKL